MKKTLLFIGTVLMAMSLMLVSCNKDEDEKPNNTSTEEPDPEPDLSKYDIMPHQWTITQLNSSDINQTILTLINNAVASGSLFINFNGEEGGPETNYAGWNMNILYNTTSVLTIGVVSYNHNTQEFELSYNENNYSGVVQISEDEQKVYMSVDAQAPLSGNTFTIVAYTLK